jgi:hypothetical protein
VEDLLSCGLQFAYSLCSKTTPAGLQSYADSERTKSFVFLCPIKTLITSDS